MSNSAAKNQTIAVSRQTLIALGLILLALAGAVGIWFYVTHHPPAWIVRWQVKRYLKKASHADSFAVTFPFPSKESMAKAPPQSGGAGQPLVKGPRTGKSFDALVAQYLKEKEALLVLEREIPGSASELTNARPRLDRLVRGLAAAQAAGETNLSVRQAQVRALQQRISALESNVAAAPNLKSREAALAEVTADLWEFQRVWDQEIAAMESSGANQVARGRDELLAAMSGEFNNAASYDAMYKLIGQQLWVAERLLGSANPDHRRVGIALALEASRRSLSDAVNGWVAARIVEGFIWPHLDLATDSNRRSQFNLETLLSQCADVFRANDEYPTVVRTYKLLLDRAETPQRADNARFQIAMACEQSGELKDALKYLRQIQLTNDFSWALRRIPRIEQQLKGGR